MTDPETAVKAASSFKTEFIRAFPPSLAGIVVGVVLAKTVLKNAPSTAEVTTPES